MNEAEELRADKPGWTSRVFGIETGCLIACDGIRAGTTWTRTEPFAFLYRGRLGGFYLLSTCSDQRQLEPGEARDVFQRLPVRFVSEEEAFAPAEAADAVAPL